MIQELSNQSDSFLEFPIPIRLSFMNNHGFPSILSLWYIIKDGKIYCATKKDAKIVEYVENNPKIGFEIAADKPPYKGVRGYGTCTIKQNLGKSILEELIGKYIVNKQSKLAQYLSKNSDREIAIEISPDKVFCYDYSKRMSDKPVKT